MQSFVLCIVGVQLLSCACGALIGVIGAAPGSPRPDLHANLQLKDEVHGSNSKIVGPASYGVDAAPENGFVALIQIRFTNIITKKQSPHVSVCTGSLITTRHVLTAASCCAKLTRPPVNVTADMLITVGAIIVDSTQKFGSGYYAFGGHHESVQAENITTNHEYFIKNRPVYPVWDLCVIKMRWNVQNLLPIPLVAPQSLTTMYTTNEVNHQVQIMGWGAQDDSDHLSPVTRLKGLATSAGKYKNCVTDLAVGLRKQWTAVGPPRFICLKRSAITSGPCDGDEGGPLIVNNTLWGVYSSRISPNQYSCVGRSVVHAYINLAAESVHVWIARAITK